MIVDIIRAIVTRVMHDKLLLGLVIIGILGIFFTGTSQNGERKHSARTVSQQAQEGAEQDGQEAGGQAQGQGQGQVHALGQAQGQGRQTGQAGLGQSQGQGQNQTQGQNQDGLTANVARDFVRWWLTKAMDYKQPSATASHDEAFAWTNPETKQKFETLFWADHIKQGIAGGTIAADFQPISVTPMAINPDGSVVVTVVGTLCMQQNGQMPASQQLTMDFLVKKVGGDCRIADFYNKLVVPVGQTQ